MQTPLPPTDSEPRDTKGRFVRSAPDDELLDLVRDVALIACEGDLDEAECVTTRAWNKARPLVDRADLPHSASVVIRRLDLSWPNVLRVSFTEPSARGVMLAGVSPSQGQPASDALIHKSLRAAAYRRGSSPTPDEYDQVIRLIERERAEAFGDEHGLPSSATIRARYDSWADACKAAGITPPERAPLVVATAADVMIDCIRETGCVPSKRWFEAWCRARGRMQPFEKHSLTVEKARELWTEDGGVWPDACPSRVPLPEASEAVEGDRRRRNYWTDERVMVALRAYAEDAIRRGVSITHADYKACVRDRDDLDLPSLSYVTRRGSLADLVRRARAGAKTIPSSKAIRA